VVAHLRWPPAPAELTGTKAIHCTDWLADESTTHKNMDKITESMNRVMIAKNGILDDLYRRYHANDKAVKCLNPDDAHRWYKPNDQKNCFTGQGSMPCPVCKTGTLRYSRAAYNGHVHGRCSTDGCVAWME
jgi:hypothetical protein